MKKNSKKIILCILSILIMFGCSACDFGGSAGGLDIVAYEPTYQKLMTSRQTISECNLLVVATYYKNVLGANSIYGGGTGSGVIVHQDLQYYYAITNWHVVTKEGSDSSVVYVETYFSDNDILAEIVVADGEQDLAIIRFRKAQSPTLPLINIKARANDPAIRGEMLLAVGNPSGVRNVVTFGICLGFSSIENTTYNVLCHNALIYPGNSGGALTDADGNLLGINTWGRNNADINFSIPLSQVLNFMEEHISSFKR